LFIDICKTGEAKSNWYSCGGGRHEEELSMARHFRSGMAAKLEYPHLRLADTPLSPGDERHEIFKSVASRHIYRRFAKPKGVVLHFISSCQRSGRRHRRAPVGERIAVLPDMRVPRGWRELRWARGGVRLFAERRAVSQGVNVVRRGAPRRLL
jgi:hypothetical protein